MQPAEIRDLLALHQRTYDLLLHLESESLRDPGHLGPDDVQCLRTRAGALAWLREAWPGLPEALRPSAEYEADANGATQPDFVRTANLLASFLDVSFRVSHLAWDGELIDTRVSLGASPAARGGRARAASRSTQRVKQEALTRLGRMHGCATTDKRLRAVVRHAPLAHDVSLCAYVWELRQRAHGRRRGPEVHSLWRSLPPEVRRDMSEPRLSAALARVLQWLASADSAFVSATEREDT